MGPEQAMGTFLRVWRAEWARLSRAQLAACLHTASQGARGVTPRVLRRWEEGQPPATTEELEALCQAMLHHGLVKWEVDDFRKCVFAACVGRQYPELFADRDLAHDPDVVDVAYSWFVRVQRLRYPIRVVELVASLEELEAVAGARFGRPAAGTQEARQELGVAYLRWALAYHHASMGRNAAAAATYGDQLQWLRARLPDRRRRDPTLTILADTAQEGRLTHTAKATGSPATLFQLLDLHRAALDQGDVERAMSRLYSALIGAYALGDPGFHAVIRPMGLRHPAVFDLDGGRPGLRIAYATIELQDGHAAEAERTVETTASAAEGGPHWGMWLALAGDLMMAHGKVEEARDYYQKGFELAQATGLGCSQLAFAKHLAELEQMSSLRVFPVSKPAPLRPARQRD